MKVKYQEPLFRPASPNRLEMHKGGGCIGCFGIPFFAAGIFMLLAIKDGFAPDFVKINVKAQVITTPSTSNQAR